MKRARLTAVLLAAAMLMSALAVVSYADSGSDKSVYPYYYSYPYPYPYGYPAYGSPSAYPLTGYPATIYPPYGTPIDVYPSYGYPVYVARPPYYPSYLPYPLPIVLRPAEPEKSETEPAEEPKWVNPFNDIPYDADYLEALEFVVTRGLFSGISATEFAPDATMTRAMFVTVLGRIAGVSVSSYRTSSFTDVSQGTWYAPYVEWAAEKNIVCGYGDGTFRPEANVTIEEAVTFLARFAGYKNEYNDYTNFMSRYYDTDEIDEWALPYMGWASAYLIYNGVRGYLNPQKPATRSEIAVIVWNFAK